MTGIAMRKKDLTDLHYLSPLTVDDGREQGKPSMAGLGRRLPEEARVLPREPAGRRGAPSSGAQAGDRSRRF